MSAHVGDGETGHDDQAADHVALGPRFDGQAGAVGRFLDVERHVGVRVDIQLGRWLKTWTAAESYLDWGVM